MLALVNGRKERPPLDGGRTHRQSKSTKPACTGFAGIMLCIVALSGCAPESVLTDEPSQPGSTIKLSFQVDKAVLPSQDTVEGLDHGPPRTVGVMVAPDGRAAEFVSNEILLHPASQEQLQAFIDKYGATVLDDGTPVVIPGDEQRAPAEPSGFYLLRIDPSKVSLDELAQDIAAAQAVGQQRFSSDDAARTFALSVHEKASGAELNLMTYDDAVNEHPISTINNVTTFVDAETFDWLNEDTDPNTPGDQGLSTGVIHAWDYLSYKGILDRPGTFFVPIVAVVDNGFDLDTTTGKPLHNNADFWNSFNAPLQGDAVDHDSTAGGPNTGTCGNSPCPWHGQGAFGIAMAYPKNGFGSAGVGGHFVRPMVYRSGHDISTRAGAIRSAAINGADVISMSWHYTSQSDTLDSAIAFARSWGVVCLAAAGNGTVDSMNVRHLEDVGSVDIYPCETTGVICVGAVDHSKNNAFNFGTPVDIWAPTNMLSTVTPDSAAADANDVGMDELSSFGGTSAATPFVAGLVGLLKSAKPDLNESQVLSTLQSTANTSPDAIVARGYVDAFRAVQAVLPNQPPSIRITSPNDHIVVGWKTPPSFTVDYHDPEVVPDDIYRWHGEVAFTSDADGELCRSSSPPYSCHTTLPELHLGAQLVTATATDPFGGKSIYQIKMIVANRPPEAHIVTPTASDTLFSHIPVHLSGYTPDPDETIDEANITWSSSLDGVLGTGSSLTHPLTAGTHTLILTAVDGKGLSAQDQLVVTVQSGAGLPTPVIVSPDDHILVAPGQEIELVGSASDPEDGTLSGASLEWSSSLDGPLGTGNSIKVKLSAPSNPCNGSFDHVITLKAKDADGHEVSVHMTIHVGIIC